MDPGSSVGSSGDRKQSEPSGEPSRWLLLDKSKTAVGYLPTQQPNVQHLDLAGLELPTVLYVDGQTIHEP